MPYEIVPKKGSFVVRNKETHRVLGTHKTLAGAKAQLKAVYANTGGK